MLSKNKIKFINSLKIKKFRNINMLFIAEGEKLITDICESGAVTHSVFSTNEKFLSNEMFNRIETDLVLNSEMSKISSLKTSTTALALFEINKDEFMASNLINTASIYCDGIQNPGNLGTIIRTADWFGIKNVICSYNTADIYNPKTIQATMGAIVRMNIFYEEPIVFFNAIKKENISSYGAFLEGDNLFESKINKSVVFVIGSEGQGISKETGSLLDKKITIPRIGQNAESLNAAIAAGVIMAEYSRRF